MMYAICVCRTNVRAAISRATAMSNSIAHSDDPAQFTAREVNASRPRAGPTHRTRAREPALVRRRRVVLERVDEHFTAIGTSESAPSPVRLGGLYDLFRGRCNPSLPAHASLRSTSVCHP
jgi:hypothetical protein